MNSQKIQRASLITDFYTLFSKGLKISQHKKSGQTLPKDVIDWETVIKNGVHKVH